MIGRRANVAHAQHLISRSEFESWQLTGCGYPMPGSAGASARIGADFGTGEWSPTSSSCLTVCNDDADYSNSVPKPARTSKEISGVCAHAAGSGVEAAPLSASPANTPDLLIHQFVQVFRRAACCRFGCADCCSACSGAARSSPFDRRPPRPGRPGIAGLV